MTLRNARYDDEDMNALLVRIKQKDVSKIYCYVVSLYGKNRKIQINVL